MKKRAIVLLVCGLTASAYTVGAYGAVSLQEIKAFLNKSVNVKVNGVKWQGKDANGNVAYPITYKGTTYLPVKAIGEALNVSVGWDDPSNSVLIGEGAIVEKTTPQTKEQAQYDTGIIYDQLARNPNDYKEKKVKFYGKVVQVIEEGQDGAETQLRVAVKGSESGGGADDIVFVYYKKNIVKSRILENDMITFYGVSKGLYTYTSTLGGAITIPLIQVDKIDIAPIGEGASVTTVGSSRRNPAPLRTNVNIQSSSYSGKFTGIASVDRIIRGEAAWEKIKNRYSGNDPAGEGYEYILAMITVKVVSTEKEDQAITVSTKDFKLVSSSGKEYGSDFVLEPDPALDASLYAGGTTTGYAVFKVSVDDKTPLLTYGRNSDGTSGSWFKVTE